MADVMKEDDNQHDEEIVIVEDESQLSQNQNQDEDDDDQDDGVVAKQHEDDDGTEDEREAIRERRRLEKQERKVRREEAIRRDKLELDFLRKRNDDLERRLTAQEQRAFTGDLNAYDAAIAQAAKEAEMADQVIAKAVAAGNGEDVTQAMRYRDQALARIQQLNVQKQQLANARPQPKQPQIDDMVMENAKRFMAENPWYDSQGRDEDSSIVIAIDQSLAKDGYDPRSEEYWDELRRRAAKRLPERFGKAKDTAAQQRNPRGGPAVGSGREHAPATTRKEIYVSPERKQALIEAGVWDDPVLRAKYVKRYAEYDRNNRA